MMESLQLLPAVDVSGGRAVQLAQGVAGSARVFGAPVESALRWQEAGAQWVHLVDIDAAFQRGSNRGVLQEVVAALDIDVEVSGGIRDEESLGVALETGCRRAVLSTTALGDSTWCASMLARHGDRIAVGLDVRGATLAARGSTTVGGALWEVLAWLDANGCGRYVVTDVARDGTLEGPNLALLREVCSRTTAPVIASGGVSSLDDLAALAALVGDGVEGAIIGTALYTGAFTLADALETVAKDRPG